MTKEVVFDPSCVHTNYECAWAFAVKVTGESVRVTSISTYDNTCEKVKPSRYYKLLEEA